MPYIIADGRESVRQLGGIFMQRTLLLLALAGLLALSSTLQVDAQAPPRPTVDLPAPGNALPDHPRSTNSSAAGTISDARGLTPSCTLSGKPADLVSAGRWQSGIGSFGRMERVPEGMTGEQHLRDFKARIHAEHGPNWSPACPQGQRRGEKPDETLVADVEAQTYGSTMQCSYGTDEFIDGGGGVNGYGAQVCQSWANYYWPYSSQQMDLHFEYLYCPAGCQDFQHPQVWSTPYETIHNNTLFYVPGPDYWWRNCCTQRLYYYRYWTEHFATDGYTTLVYYSYSSWQSQGNV